MKITEKLLKEILVDSELISPKDFNLAKSEAEDKKKLLEEIIIDRKLISEEELGSLISDKIGFLFANLKKVKINKEVLETIPEIVARKQEVIVFDKTKEGLRVAMAHPENLEFREFLERKTGEKVIPYFTTKRNISAVLKYYKKEIKEEFEEIIGKTLEEFKKIETRAPQSLPIIKIVELILNYGYENRASDIHIEPYINQTILRYRIDGVLHDILTLPKNIHDFLISRIKILAKLRTDEHEAAQDGHFSFQAPEEKFDIRVSIVPIEEGEKAVMRLLAERARKFELKELGLDSKDLKIIRKNLKKSWGMILATGPTGCGKTTTLYGMLKILNTRGVNIMTIEDPIEYDIEGINQIQVNPKAKLAFSQGLRAIIRQDPNIIMVGEIRDEETAKLAINAAMTGHLVLSTFHAIDTPTVLIRLLDMGIEPFLVISTVNVVIAQRLVRKICSKCIESYETPFSEIKRLLGTDFVSKLPKTKKNQVRLFRGRGCPLCQKTGFLGRIGIFEILEMKEPIKKLVLEKAPSSKIKEEAKKLGMTTMVEDGLKKVEMGITTIEEVLRTVK
ncbi:type II/IV secretion system protein [Patescibacteria group bacterium]|nr:type II/IV secretion system protein [Patescibacteria group bacterium]